MIEATERRGRGRPKGATNGSCLICRSLHRKAVEERLALGRPFTSIIKEAEAAGVQLTTTQLRRHVEHSPGLVTEETIDPEEVHLDRSLHGTRKDLAVVIRDRVLSAVEKNQIELSASHGLKAQEILDRRETNAAKMEFALNLARLLTGGGKGAPVELIEGVARDVTDVTDVDAEATNPLLAPPELRLASGEY